MSVYIIAKQDEVCDEQFSRQLRTQGHGSVKWVQLCRQPENYIYYTMLEPDVEPCKWDFFVVRIQWEVSVSRVKVMYNILTRACWTPFILDPDTCFVRSFVSAQLNFVSLIITVHHPTDAPCVNMYYFRTGCETLKIKTSNLQAQAQVCQTFQMCSFPRSSFLAQLHSLHDLWYRLS